MRFTPNYSVCVLISACIDPFHTTTFTHSLTQIYLLQRTIHNIWMEFIWSQKIFHVGIQKLNSIVTYKNSTLADVILS